MDVWHSQFWVVVVVTAVKGFFDNPASSEIHVEFGRIYLDVALESDNECTDCSKV